jgi:hypothetical protein
MTLSTTCIPEAGQIEEEIGKLHFNKYLKGQTLTLEQEVNTEETQQLASPHLLLDAKLLEQGDKKELTASAFLFEVLTSCKNPWVGGE